MYGEVAAVKGSSFSLKRGEILTLLGPSGCGKTTTLNMIAGLEDITDGTLLFDARDVTRLPPHQREVAMVFQSYALYPNKTVAQNIAFPLKLRGVASAEIARAVAEVVGGAHHLPRGGLLVDSVPRALDGHAGVARGAAVHRPVGHQHPDADAGDDGRLPGAAEAALLARAR